MRMPCTKHKVQMQRRRKGENQKMIFAQVRFSCHSYVVFASLFCIMSTIKFCSRPFKLSMLRLQSPCLSPCAASQQRWRSLALVLELKEIGHLRPLRPNFKMFFLSYFALWTLSLKKRTLDLSFRSPDSVSAAETSLTSVYICAWPAFNPCEALCGFCLQKVLYK